MDHMGMSNQIHPTAILEGNISLGAGNFIGPNVVLRGHISIGSRNHIGPGTIMENTVEIGDDNHLYGHVSLGAMGEMGLKGDRLVPEGKVVIGHNVNIREFVCIHAPVYTLETRINDSAYLMNKSYIAHDCVIGRNAVLSAGVLLGGRVEVGQGANIGMGAAIHQRCHIGAFAMVGMLTPVTRDILPYCTVAGNPCRIIGFNKAGAERAGHSAELFEEMERYFKEAFISGGQLHPIMKEIEDFLRQYPNALTLSKSHS
jgi:UDP-N-acetylglucosamine acyltransferase